MASESHASDDFSEIQPQGTPRSDASTGGSDWFSYNDQTDLEDLKRKVEQLKAQAGMSTRPKAAPSTPLESEPETAVQTRPLMPPVENIAAKPPFHPTILSSLDESSSDDVKPLFSPTKAPALGTAAPKPREASPGPLSSTPSPIQAARPAIIPNNPGLNTQATSAPRHAPTASASPAQPKPPFTPQSEPAPPQLLKPATPITKPAAGSPGSVSAPPLADRPQLPRTPGAETKSSAATTPNLSADELRGTLRTTPTRKRSGVPFSLFTMTFMYAVTVSTVCGYLVHERLNGRPDILESLPDVPVPSVGGHAASSPKTPSCLRAISWFWARVNGLEMSASHLSKWSRFRSTMLNNPRNWLCG